MRCDAMQCFDDGLVVWSAWVLGWQNFRDVRACVRDRRAGKLTLKGGEQRKRAAGGGGRAGWDDFLVPK